MVPLDPAHQIGLTPLLKEVLIPDEGYSGWKFKNCKIWYIFNYCEKTDRDMDKQMVQLDSAHQISVEIIFDGFLTAFRRCYSGKDGSCHMFGGAF